VNFLSEVSYEEVVGQWLQREYSIAVKKGRCLPNQEALVLDTDYRNPIKNQQRFLLLKYRWNLLCPIPRDTKWYKAKIAKGDLTSLRVINDEANEKAWSILSDRTGMIKRASDNFIDWPQNPQNIPTISHPQTKQLLTKLLADIAGFRSRAGNANQDLTLILVGNSKEEHFTVLEGNKTSIGLYLHHFVDQPDSDYPEHHAYVGTSPAMNYYPWHHRT